MHNLRDALGAMFGGKKRGGLSLPGTTPLDTSADARSLFQQQYKAEYGKVPGELGGKPIEQLLPSAETFTDEVKFKGVLRFLAEHPGDVGLDHIPNRMITSGLKKSDILLVAQYVNEVQAEYLLRIRDSLNQNIAKLESGRYNALDDLKLKLEEMSK